MPNYNSNTLILLPKTNNVDSVEMFRPIALATFKFIIISNIIVGRLASIMPTIISKHQKGCVQGRCIKDCTGLTFEAINLMHKKAFGGIISFSVDIFKEFDSLEAFLGYVKL